MNSGVDLPDGWHARRPALADAPEILTLTRAVCLAVTGRAEYEADISEGTVER